MFESGQHMFSWLLFFNTDHGFKCQHDILISSLHEEDDLVRSAMKKQLFNKALLHPSERGRALTVATTYYK